MTGRGLGNLLSPEISSALSLRSSPTRDKVLCLPEPQSPYLENEK